MAVCYGYAREQGARFLLVTEKGDIKAIGNTEAVLLCSRQRKQGDMVMTIERYHRLWPYKL